MADIQVANTDADLSGNTVVTEENAYTITGLHTYSRSTNAPFACISGAAVVTYLDADKLDGQEGAYYLAAANATGTLAVNRGGTGAATFTDGGVLLGSGTSAITATAVLGDGVILIGDASGDPTTLDVGSSSAITILGTVATGVWNGTAVTVAYGGTGTTSLTDGGVLLGSGTGAITAMSVLADSEMIVGNGSTDPVAESGATLRTSIGVGTGDSPQFTGLTTTSDVAVATSVLFVDVSATAIGVGTATPNYLSSAAAITLQGSTQPRLEIVGTRTSDDTVGVLTFINQVSGPTNNQLCYIAGNRTGADNSGSLEFHTFNGGSNVTAMTILPSGNVGIGTSSVDELLHVESAATASIKLQCTNADTDPKFILQNDARTWFIRLSGADNNKFQIRDETGDAIRLYIEEDGDVTIAEDLDVGGALSKGSGTFKISHPLPAKTDTHHLIHSFVESPDTLLIYRGSVALVAGQATIDLDNASGMTTGTWVLLCRDAQCFTSNETGWFHVRGTVTGSTLTIDCEENDCTDTVSWMVVANRKDAHILETSWTDENGYPIMEPEKPEELEEP